LLFPRRIVSGTTMILEPEAGWTPVSPLSALGPIRSFLSGDATGARIQVSYFRRDRDRALLAKVWFGPGAEGPPGHAHGGSIAAVLDEAMGAAAWMVGIPVLARSIRVQFRTMVPLEHVVTVEAAVRAAYAHRVHANAMMYNSSGVPFAEASGLFVEVKPERLGLPRSAVAE
jgi:acyl-coenzyme A thioesterase PaaI-like protein